MVDELRERGLLPKVVIAFLCIWLVWGSTFLAIRVAIEHLPPLLMCAVRLLLAGALLFAWAKATGVAWPEGKQLRNAALVGILLPATGNASVTIGVQHMPSGLAALMVSTIPLWMALIASVGRFAVRPAPQVIVGLVLGFSGIALLIGPGLMNAKLAEFSPFWALVPIAGSVSWAWGSLWSRRVSMPSSPLLSTGVGMLAGGVCVLALSGALGEFARFRPAEVPMHSIAALLYLVVFGSVVGFTAYLYLLRTVPPAVVSTYAFVNPIVAMALGWAFAGEALTGRTMLAAAVVIAAVVLITTSRAPAQPVRGTAVPAEPTQP
ncbi:MAG: EamA family transporter [Candidatus Eisenbacteria bacterium]|nr:EamA family transporter [Candidatus Eisenbacteria bacterium]